MKNNLSKCIIIMIMSVLLATVGCGGDGKTATEADTAIISGVAAAGAPLSGYVSLKDSQDNPSPALRTLLDNEGNFSFDVTGLVPPFYLKAEGVAGNTAYELHSIVTAVGTANINPLTEAQSLAAGGVDPADLYDDPSQVTLSNEDMQVALEQAAEDLKTMLQPLLDAWEAPMLNPITDVYVADGTGLDQLFHIVQVNVNEGEILVVDKATGDTIGAADINENGGLTLTDEIIDDEVIQPIITDLDEIKTFLADWLTGMKTITAGFVNGDYDQQEALNAMMAYYVDADSFGVNNGRDLEGDLEEQLEDYVFYNAIKSIVSVGIDSYDESAGIYRLTAVLNLQLYGPSVLYTAPTMAVVKIGDDWKVTGNGFYANTGIMDLVEFKTEQSVFNDQTTQTTVIDFEMDDDQNVFEIASVEGPGLPGGIIYFYPNEHDWNLVMDYDLMACIRYNNDGSCREVEWNVYEMTDDTIEAMPQVCTYTVTFVFSDGRPDEVHSTSLIKPLSSSQITDSHFPEIHNSFTLTTDWALENLIGQTVDIDYSTPTAFDPLHVGFGAWFSYRNNQGHSDDFEVWKDDVTYGPQQTKSMTFPDLPDGATMRKADFEIQSTDTFWRSYEVAYYFRCNCQER